MKFNHNTLIIDQSAFTREKIQGRVDDLGFNNISRFELFLWDLEIFLQIQKRMGDKILLKGGAATQFYIPIDSQRTSIDIDMICLLPREAVKSVISDIESAFAGEGEYFRFQLYAPSNPKVGLDMLETYYITVPSICTDNELRGLRNKQQVKVEFLYRSSDYPVYVAESPELFAASIDQKFNLLPLTHLFADKLTTIGPETIGIPEERGDEQFKQIYDVITLFHNNQNTIWKETEIIHGRYQYEAKKECDMHGISFVPEILFTDMMRFIKRIQNIESEPELFQRANDFQALYLRRAVSRNKQQWSIVGYQLELITTDLLMNKAPSGKYQRYSDLTDLVTFANISGPERSQKINQVRTALKNNFDSRTGYQDQLFRKSLERIIWGLSTSIEAEELNQVILSAL